MGRTRSLAGSKVALRGAIAVAVGLAVFVGALVWHASTLEIREGVRGEADVVVSDGWSIPSGFFVVSTDERTGGRALAALAEDGEVLTTVDISRQRLAQVAMAGDVVFLDDGHRPSAWFGATSISVVRLDDGRFVQAWSQGFVDDESGEVLVELTAVGHAPSGETAIFGCAREAGRCWFLGVDPAGKELWRLPADDRWPTPVAERNVEQRPWLVPEELIVIGGREHEDGRRDRPIFQVDLGSGEVTEVATAARAVTGHGFTVLATVDDDGCDLLVVRNGSAGQPVEVPCADDGGAPRHTVVGTTVMFTTQDQVVAVGIDHERIGTYPSESVLTWTGVGTVLTREPDLQLRTVGGDVIADLGSDWASSAVAHDTLVVRRTHRSANPFAADVRTEVQVIDAADGSVCARARIDGEPSGTVPHQSLLALAGCSALVEIGGTTYLLGR